MNRTVLRTICRTLAKTRGDVLIKRFLFACAACVLLVVPVRAADSIELLPMDLKALATADREKLEESCYPSGMSLPTKWLDISSFMPFEGEFEPEKEVYDLLVANWATGGKYTFAEYSAAKLYIGCVKLNELAKDSELTDSVRKCVYSGILPLSSTAELSEDTEYLNRMFELFGPVLAAAADSDYPAGLQEYADLVNVSSFEFVPTLSYDFPWLSAYDGVLSEDVMRRAATFFNSLGAWYTRIGVTFTPMEGRVSWVRAAVEEDVPTASDIEVDVGDNDVTELDRYHVPVKLTEETRFGLADIFTHITIVITAWAVFVVLIITWRRKRS